MLEACRTQAEHSYIGAFPHLGYNCAPRMRKMVQKISIHSLARRALRAALSILLLSVIALAQDPSGRPSDPKGKKPPAKKPPTKIEPSVMLTVLTDPPASTVLINGEQRGVTDAEGKIQFDKLAIGHYTIEVRKDGYGPILRGFEAGSDSPTIVFKLEARLDDAVKEFNSLVASGKLMGPDTPNALEFLEALAGKYGDRPDVAQLKVTLAAKLVEAAAPVITQSVMNWRAVTRDQMVRARDAAASALALKKDDTRLQAEAAYLRGVAALREWQVAGAPAKSEGNGQGDANGNANGPAAARAEFENALKLEESYAPARYQLGVTLLASGDAAGAEAALLKITQAEPRWASGHTALGSAYYVEGKLAEAIAAHRKALEIDPSNVTALAGLGLARAGKGEKDGAKDLERAMKLDATSALPHLNLAIVLSQSKNKKDWTKAEEEFKKAISMNPQNIEFQNSAAEGMLAEVQKRKK